MKRAIITLLVIINFIFTIKAQSFSKDTVICVIDTTNCFVKFRVNPFAGRIPEIQWQVSIKGHYYDERMPRVKDNASIVFNYGDPIIDNSASLTIKMTKENITKRFVVVTDKWINQQTNISILRKKIGAYPLSKCNFIIFKPDFDTKTNDSIKMYRVPIGYYESIE